MLLSDTELREAIKAERLVFSPSISPVAVQAASIDLTLHNVFWRSNIPEGEGIEVHVDITARSYHYNQRFDEDEIVLRPGEFVLGETAEGISLADDLCGMIEGKSGRARHGLIVHCTAPHIAPGWGLDPPNEPDEPKVPNPKRITLEIANLGPVILHLKAGVAIAQLLVMPTGKPAQAPYEGTQAQEGS